MSGMTTLEDRLATFRKTHRPPPPQELVATTTTNSTKPPTTTNKRQPHASALADSVEEDQHSPLGGGLPQSGSPAAAAAGGATSGAASLRLLRGRPGSPTVAGSFRTLSRHAGSVDANGDVEDNLYSELANADKRVLTAYLVVWSVTFGTAVWLEFGAVYFAVSLLYSLWRFGLRQRRRSGEASAYSVFNPGVVPIQGSQLTGEDLQRNMGLR